jgi:bifunctional non-homologous end joining protein LigD
LERTAMTLTTYRKKRNFAVTPEPSGGDDKSKSHGIYVIQKHRATSLHYDFRLEFDGTLLSWAVPKGPSLDPSVKRLAMQVEDHPVEYASFEGVIPEGEYGGGTVMVWDQGTWTPDDPDVKKSMEAGELKFSVDGEKLRGSWVLVRTRGYGHNADRSWLLIKHRDQYASKNDIALEAPRSVVSNRLLADIAREGGGDVEKASTGDPSQPQKRGKNSPVAQPAEKSRPSSKKKAASSGKNAASSGNASSRKVKSRKS